MADAAGRTTRLKLGTSVLVLPGRNPVVLAKELATLAVMSDGRLPPAFGLGVVAPPELRRVGRLADGWLPSFVTPADAEAGGRDIETVAAEHEREIEADHFGVLIPYTLGAVPDVLAAQLARRRPDLDDVGELIPCGWDELAATINRFVDVGTTKFVVLPVDEPGDVDGWDAYLNTAADALLPLET